MTDEEWKQGLYTVEFKRGETWENIGQAAIMEGGNVAFLFRKSDTRRWWVSADHFLSVYKGARLTRQVGQD